MKIYIQSRKGVIDDRLGRLAHGSTVDLPDHKALFYLARGEAIRYEVKVERDRPCVTVGEEQLLSASPAVQASAQTTLSESDSGETPKRKRGRPRKLSS